MEAQEILNKMKQRYSETGDYAYSSYKAMEEYLEELSNDRKDIKRKEHKCSKCGLIFNHHLALAGHKRSHK